MNKTKKKEKLGKRRTRKMKTNKNLNRKKHGIKTLTAALFLNKQKGTLKISMFLM